jgi:hypothetical protein
MGGSSGLWAMNTVLFPSGLPDYLVHTSNHSVSNHQRRDRGSPSCQRVWPATTGFVIYQQTRPRLADRIEFTCPGVSGLVTDWPFSKTVAPHSALRRRSYGSIPHDDASPQKDGLAPSCAHAISGALVGTSRCDVPAPYRRGTRFSQGSEIALFISPAERGRRPRSVRSLPCFGAGQLRLSG